MYKHILIALDDSETSLKALDEAILLARNLNAVLEIAHAVDESVMQTFANHGMPEVDPAKIHYALLDSGRMTLSEGVAKAKAAGLTPRERFLSSEDRSASDQIASAVKDSGADLLVVGSHGRRGVKRMLLGSVAENLMRKVDISVLVVRGQH